MQVLALHARQSGLQNGDMLVNVQGTKVDQMTHSQVIDLLSMARTMGSVLEMTVMRKVIIPEMPKPSQDEKIAWTCIRILCLKT